MNYVTKDSGARETYTSGAVRDVRENKGRFDLLSPVFLRRLSGVYERGAAKYKPRNWEQGMPLSRFVDSARRHINEYMEIALARREGLPDSWLLERGIDPEEDHLAHAAWNLASIIHLEEVKPETDDLHGVEYDIDVDFPDEREEDETVTQRLQDLQMELPLMLIAAPEKVTAITTDTATEESQKNFLQRFLDSVGTAMKPGDSKGHVE